MMSTSSHSPPSTRTKTVELEDVSKSQDERSDANDSDSNSIGPLLLPGTQPEYDSTNVNAGRVTSAVNHKKKCPRKNMCRTFLELVVLVIMLNNDSGFLYYPTDVPILICCKSFKCIELNLY